MIKYNYPEYQQHKDQHPAYIKSFEELKNTLERENASPVIAIKFQKLLTDWWIGHIGNVYLKLGRFWTEKLKDPI